MGKRQRKRNRERRSEIILFPDRHNPLLQITIATSTPAEMRQLCTSYWSFEQPGKWTYPARSLRLPSGQAANLVAARYCQTLALTLLCPVCKDPFSVSSRQELVTKAPWCPDRYPRTPEVLRNPCPECQQSVRDARLQEQQARQEAEEARRAQDARRAEEAAEHARRDEALIRSKVPGIFAEFDQYVSRSVPKGSMPAAEFLLLTAIFEACSVGSAPAMAELPLGWTGAPEADKGVLLALLNATAILPASDTPIESFRVDNVDGQPIVVLGQPDLIRWRVGSTRDRVRAYLHDLETTYAADPELVNDVAHEVRTMDTLLLMEYIDGTLAIRYDYPPVPEHRLYELASVLGQALAHGYTYGQVLAMCWGAIASAVAWRVRTPGVTDSQGSSAAVTNLVSRVDRVRMNRSSVPEYATPTWLDVPPAVKPARQALTRLSVRATPVQSSAGLPVDTLE
ncbi:hypothetical protein ACFY2W_04090 [Streptomyces sp. NPDC001262]|uniref:hypothetical protein n=1 Tax=Streptomyces sp. NPDC001262 TaxID=3364552 RepID=UPI00367CBAF3